MSSDGSEPPPAAVWLRAPDGARVQDGFIKRRRVRSGAGDGGGDGGGVGAGVEGGVGEGGGRGDDAFGVGGAVAVECTPEVDSSAGSVAGAEVVVVVPSVVVASSVVFEAVAAVVEVLAAGTVGVESGVSASRSLRKSGYCCMLSKNVLR